MAKQIFFKAYGFKWTKPQTSIIQHIATANADGVIDFQISKQGTLLFDARLRNETRNGLRCNLLHSDSLRATAHRRWHVDEAKIQTSDNGCVWCFNSPRPIFSNYVQGRVEDCTTGDTITLQVTFSVRIMEDN